MEIWKVVPEYPLYAVSDLGRARSLDGYRPRGTGQVFIKGKILTPVISKNGYPFIAIGKKRVYVHKLVMLSFVGPRPAGMEVRHLDGNRANPRFDNLCYGTSSQNREDAYRHGTRNPETDRKIAAKTIATKYAKYGPHWSRAGFAGVKYSELDL